MKYQSIIPAIDWFFVYEIAQPNAYAKFAACRLVAFALSEDGHVEGLLPTIGLPGTETNNAKLIESPQTRGEFVHLKELLLRTKEGVTFV